MTDDVAAREPGGPTEAREPGGPAHAATENPWRRLARRTAYENRWLTLFEDRVIRPDGDEGIYGVVHFHNLAVGVVVLDGDDRTLLIGQYRYPTDHYSWEIPEGGADPAEAPLAAAKRELLEEAGYEADGWQQILRAELSNSVTDEMAFVFLATRPRRVAPASPEGTEVLSARWVPFEEALRMVDDGEIVDALAILGLQRVALLRSRVRPAG